MHEPFHSPNKIVIEEIEKLEKEIQEDEKEIRRLLKMMSQEQLNNLILKHEKLILKHPKT